MRFHEIDSIEFKAHQPTVNEQPSLEKFDTLNTLNLITNQVDFVMPVELEKALIQFIVTCLDYKVDKGGAHFITQLVQSNSGSTDRGITLSSISGLNNHVINTLIRQQLICKMNELANEHDRTGASFDKKLYL
ncbi:hypothetical protein VoSk93_39900 [Vibrio owensii]